MSNVKKMSEQQIKQQQESQPGIQTKKSYKERQEKVLEAVTKLIEHFPKTFFAKEQVPKPLKVNIHADVIEHFKQCDHVGLSNKDIRQAIKYYTSRMRYYRACVAGARRIDLNGVELDEITSEQAEHAKAQYELAQGRRRESLKRKKDKQQTKKASADKLSQLAQKWGK